MNLTRTSVKRPLTIIMVFLVVVMFGAIGYSKMPANLMPDIEVPVVLVTTQWTGAGPEDIDEQVSEKIEEKLAAVSNVKDTMSVSRESMSMVAAQFEYGTDVDEMLNDIRSKIDMVTMSLPDDVEKPTILKMDMNAQAIAQIVVDSETANGDALMQYAEETLQQKFESIDGVTSADIKGGDKSQVNIIADPAVLSNYNISLSTIQNVLASTNKTFPYGSITQGEDTITLRAIDELNSLEDVKNIQIPVGGGQTVRLDTICDVEYGKVEKDSIYRYNGKESLIIDIQKQQDANTVQVMDKVHSAVEELNKENSTFTLTVTNDSSTMINDSINSVMQNLLISSIISFFVILAFLKNIRASLVVAVAIPTSIVGTIALLYFTGETLNMITLGALVLAVGMVVDNATVVIENIFQYRRDTDLDIDECAIEGTRTVSNAVVASTLTTVAIFLPIIFTEGFVSIMFGALSKTLVFALTLSLIVAITLVPSIFAKLSGGKNAAKMAEKPTPLFDKFSNGYQSLLRLALNHRKIAVLLSIVMFVGSIVIAGSGAIGMDFMSSSDEGKISISMTLPQGLDLEANDYYVSMAEEKIADISEIKTVLTSLGSSSLGTSSSNSATINIELVPEKERKKSTDEIEQEIIALMDTVPDCEINVSQSTSMVGGGDTIEMDLSGPDLDVLKVISEEAKQKVEETGVFRNVETSLSDTTQEAQFKINKYRAQEYGINTAGIASLLRTAVSGSNVTTATIDDYKVDVNLKFKDTSIDNIEDIKQIKVTSTSGKEVPIGAFADVEMADGLQTINKQNGDYVITISGIADGLDTSKASGLMNQAISSVDFPKDYQVAVGGMAEMMNESMSGLVFAMLIALVLVYMVMVAQFESFSKPFIIMFCIPFAFVGVILALLITRTNLNVVGMLGVILLIGIVINNGIVLIDHVEQLRKSNHDEDLIELVAHGSATRLRPVLMTTLTTIIGMVPTALAFGTGGETMQPLAIVIIGGLSISTLVTLVLIPTIYMIFDNLETKFKGVFGKLKKNPNVEESFDNSSINVKSLEEKDENKIKK